MSKQDYIRGFATKCAEAGLDARQSGFLFKIADSVNAEAGFSKEAEDFYKRAWFFQGGDEMDEFRSQQRANTLKFLRDLGIEQWAPEDGLAEDNKIGTGWGRFWTNHFQSTGSGKREIRGQFDDVISRAIENAKKNGWTPNAEQQRLLDNRAAFGNANQHRSGMTDEQRDAAMTGRISMNPQTQAPAANATPQAPAAAPQAPAQADPYANNLYYQYSKGMTNAPLSVGEDIDEATGQIFRRDGRPLSGRAQQWNSRMYRAGQEMGGISLGAYQKQLFANAPQVRGAYGGQPAAPAGGQPAAAPAGGQPAAPAQKLNRFGDTVSYGKGNAAVGSNYAKPPPEQKQEATPAAGVG